MNRTAPFASALFLVSVVGCALEPDEHPPSGEPSPTFEAFAATAYVEPETGLYIVDGDVPLVGVEGLKAYYDARFGPGGAEHEDHIGTTHHALTLNTVDGADDVWWGWGPGLVVLTYCVSSAFGQRHRAMVEAMRVAAADWDHGGRVSFRYVPEEDPYCVPGNHRVDFDVRPTSGKPYYARAFLPSASRFYRNILVDEQAWSAHPWTVTGFMRHELGHVLGFRHEHARRADLPHYCSPESNDYRPLTAYDSASVMHYQHCYGTGSGDYTLTELDRVGMVSVYGGDAHCIIGDYDGKNCFVTQAPAGTEPFIWRNDLYITPGGRCAAGVSDGVNCLVLEAQPGTEAFVWRDGLYTTRPPGRICPVGDYDGVHCFVAHIPPGTEGFVWNGGLYTTPRPWCPIGTYDGVHCRVAETPDGMHGFVWRGGLYTTPRHH